MPYAAANLHPHLPTWAAIGLGLFGSLWLTLDAIPSLKSGIVAQAAATLLQPPTQPRAADIAAAAKLNLFGNVPLKSLADAQDLPVTSLNLTLSGIIAGKNSEESRTLISENGQAAKAYFKGDKVAGDATLYEISSNFAVIKRGDAFEKLSMYKSMPAVRTYRDRQNVAGLTETEPPAVPASVALLGPPQEIHYKSLKDRIAAINRRGDQGQQRDAD